METSDFWGLAAIFFLLAIHRTLERIADAIEGRAKPDLSIIRPVNKSKD